MTAKRTHRRTTNNQDEGEGDPAPTVRSRAPTDPSDLDPERGSATVLAVGVVAALAVFAVGFAAVGQAGAARHRAQTAADAAALAGAARVLLGEGESCAAAAELVSANGADLESCEVDDLEVTVRVTAETSGVPALFGPARAVSRAGPVTAR